jgi:hypothetical protein
VLTILLDADVATSNAGADSSYFSFCTDQPNWRGNNSLSAIFDTSGDLTIRQCGANANLDQRNFKYTGFRAAYSGTRVKMRIVFTAGTVDPFVEINGVDKSASFVFSLIGTAPWLTNSASTVLVLGNNFPAGRAPSVIPILGTLTTTEAADWRLRGVIPAWVRPGGNVSFYTSNFASTADDFSQNSGGVTVIGGVDGVAGVDDTLKITESGSGALQVRKAVFAGNNPIRAIVSFDYYADVACGVPFIIPIGNRNFREMLGSATGLAVVEGVWTSVSFTLTGSYFDISGYGLSGITTATGATNANLAAGKSIYLKNYKIKPLGAITLAEVTPDNILRDASTTATPIDGVTVGCTPQQVGTADGWIRGGGSGAGYVMADTVLLGTNRSIAEIWMYSVSGGTASLGESSGSTATLAASTSLTAGVWTKVTPLKAISSTGKLYRGLGTATDSYVAVRTMPRGTQP